MYPPKADLLMKATWEYIPVPLLRLVDYLPLKDVKRLSGVRGAFELEANKLLKTKTERLTTDKEGQKDVMSILGRLFESLGTSTV